MPHCRSPASSNFRIPKRVRDLETQYENRPSRQEDMEQIRHLDRELREREMALNQLRDEMQFYKLELVNSGCEILPF